MVNLDAHALNNYAIPISSLFFSFFLSKRSQQGVSLSLNERAAVLYWSGVSSALITKTPHTYLLFKIWSWGMHEIKTYIWIESIAGNQHNLGKFERVTVHFTHMAVSGGDCNVYQGLGSSVMLSRMFTPSILKVVYIKIPSPSYGKYLWQMK